MIQLRRDFLFDAVNQLGFDDRKAAWCLLPYADAGAFTDDSAGLRRGTPGVCRVAITPGLDFGSNQPERHTCGFAYTTALDRLETGNGRLRHVRRANAG